MHAVFSRTLAKMKGLPHLLGDSVIYCPKRPTDIASVVGWGQRPAAQRAKEYATEHGLKYLTIEDGFIRAASIADKEPLSIVMDGLGVHYDANSPSDIETWLETEELTPKQVQRGARLIEQLRRARISKYGRFPSPAASETSRQPKVLLIDQLAGDLSLTRGGVDSAVFNEMGLWAQREFPSHQLVIKLHPRAGRDGTSSSISREWFPDARFIEGEVDPFTLIDQVDHVVVATSQFGLDALIAGKPVTCFGLPFYAGWGLTQDQQSCPRRTRKRSLAELVYLAYVQYARYFHPVTRRACRPEDLLEHLELQAELTLPADARVFYLGFQRWKHHVIRSFAGDIRRTGKFVVTFQEAIAQGFQVGDTVYVWGERAGVEVDAARAHGARLVRIEDGFVRSIGLGSDLIPPLSLVFDSRGIYYDTRSPSGLESLLKQDLTEEEHLRARMLIHRLVENRITKYNVPQDEPRRLEFLDLARRMAGGAPIIFIPGQVSNDASVLRGARGLASIEALIETLRRERPEAFLLYRPHPDVMAGNRQGFDKDAEQLCDWVERDMDALTCIEAADEVHTLTSLVGFEALLRNKPVTCWGDPFYAGYGLTVDQGPVRPRSLQAGLEALVHAALLKYPRYFDMDTRMFTTPEIALERLIERRAQIKVLVSGRPGYLARKLRKARLLLDGWRCA
jgi:capsular polysaccharide export protein